MSLMNTYMFCFQECNIFFIILSKPAIKEDTAHVVVARLNNVLLLWCAIWIAKKSSMFPSL